MSQAKEKAYWILIINNLLFSIVHSDALKRHLHLLFQLKWKLQFPTKNQLQVYWDFAQVKRICLTHQEHCGATQQNELCVPGDAVLKTDPALSEHDDVEDDQPLLPLEQISQGYYVATVQHWLKLFVIHSTASKVMEGYASSLTSEKADSIHFELLATPRLNGLMPPWAEFWPVLASALRAISPCTNNAPSQTELEAAITCIKSLVNLTYDNHMKEQPINPIFCWFHTLINSPDTNVQQYFTVHCKAALGALAKAHSTVALMNGIPPNSPEVLFVSFYC